MILPTRALLAASLSLVAGMGLSACVSATSSDVPELDTPALDPRRNTPAQQCDLLTSGYLRNQLAMSFRDGRPLHGSTQQRTECQWAAESGIALVRTVVDKDSSSYSDARSESQRTLGLVTDVDIPGAKRAFQVSGYGMTGMLVKGQYVQVVVAVPTASPQAVRDIAESVAGSVAREG